MPRCAQSKLDSRLRTGLTLRSAHIPQIPGIHRRRRAELALGHRLDDTNLQHHRSVLLHAFPYKDADRLVTFTIVAADEVRAWRFPVGAFVDFKDPESQR